MTSINLTTRVLTAAALVVALLLGGTATPATGATAGRFECCTTQVNADCCGTMCCPSRTPSQDLPQPEPSRSSNDRPSDGKATWSNGGTDPAQLSRFARLEFTLGVPASGSLSLITQHVRLQI